MISPTSSHIGIDIGGTFTDIAVLGSDGSLAVRKVLSTPEDYARGIIQGLRGLIEDRRISEVSIERIAHATTVATNAILEGKGARTALITTKGFRDVLEMRRIRIPELYNLFYNPPSPLVPRHLRFELDERMDARGRVREPLQQVSLENVLNTVQQQEIEALAICLLHSYANPEHELRTVAAARESLPDIFVTTSCEVLPEIREYERTSTTVINAYLGPVMQRYLNSLSEQLQSMGIRAPLEVLHSGGGVMTADSAQKKPAHLIESGPAAGVMAAAWMAGKAGYTNVITLDMGGTTAKTAIVENGTVARTSEYEVGAGINLSSRLVKGAGYALKLPVIDIAEIGAGGGSIVSVDRHGRLRVGPESAGADPGPVCYGLGGEEPTFTDAAVLLGYLSPDALLGGKMKLATAQARRIFEKKVARPMQQCLMKAAYGAFTLACATMIRAVKSVSTYRGRDPREAALLAFGGCGPLVATTLAQALGMREVIIPPHPGLFSAFGLLVSEPEHESVRTWCRRLEEVRPEDLNRLYSELESQAVETLVAEGYRPEQIRVRRLADLRYVNQATELTVPAPGVPLGPGELTTLAEVFEQEHLTTYGHRANHDPIELVNLRIVSSVIREFGADEPRDLFRADHREENVVPNGCRTAFFGPADGDLETAVCSRQSLRAAPTGGPLIIEELDSTTVVPPGWQASMDEFQNIILRHA